MKQFYKKLATLMLVCLLGISNQVEVFAAKPGTNSRFITIGNLAKTTATVSWINGNGNGRLLVVYTGNVTQTDVDNKINDGILYSSNSNFGATGSQVLINNASGRAVIVYLAGGSTRTVNITGLTANTTYSVKAYEYKNDGGVDPEYLETGGTNNPVTFKTLAQPLPTKPTNLAAGSITDKNALASWTNGTDVEWYTMDLINYDLGQVEWEGVDIGKPNPAQFLIEGLAADTDYGYRLQSHNTEGASGYTNYHAFTTSPDATKPEMMSTEYINSNQFRLFFTEPVSFVGDVKTKFTISFYNNSNNLVSEQIIGITLEGPDNTSAICSTSVDLSTIRNGEDVTVSYQNLPSIYVKDLANNTMVTPSEILIRDWTPSKVLSSVRTKYVNPNWVTTGYGTNATTIHFLVTFDEKVKLVDANFKLDIVDGGDSNPDGTIGTITKVDLDGDGYASIYRVQCSTNVDDDCDDYSISITQNNGDDIIRDMSGNEMINTTISGPDEDYKVDRLKPSSSDNGPLNQSDSEISYSSLATQLGVTYLTGTYGADQVLDVYNLSNLNGVNPDDFVIINSAIDALDCSIEGGKVEIEYSTNGVDYNSMASYDKTIGTLDITNGYVRFMINITTLLNATTDEGKNVKFRVTTTDIGGNEVETPALAYFGSWSNATSELLYDVIAPRTPFTLTGDLFAYDYLDNDSDDDGVYFNLADNAIKTTMIKLPTIASANDNTLTGGYVEVYARRDAEEWIEFADGLTNIDAISDFNNKKFTIEDQNFINSLITSNDNLDHTIQVSFKIYDKAGNSNQYLTETLTVDRVTPNPADLSISGLAIGAINLNNTNITNLLSNDASREYFNIAAQDDDLTLYLGYGIKGGDYDQSLVGGKVYLEYKKSSYFAENITGNIQDNWIQVAYTSGDLAPLQLDLNIAINTFELPSNTNLYEELHTESEINGDVYEFRLIPIDIADNETSYQDRNAAMASTDETIVLDNVKPKLVKAYSSDLSQFYLQEFATECYGDQDDSDDRYFFNKNTGTFGGANDVVGATFEFEPDPTMNRPGNGVKSILQYYNGSNWTQLGPNSIYSSINLGTEQDNFGVANNGNYFKVTDWVNRQDITNIWNGFANNANLDNTSDLRIQVEINDVAGNSVTVIPTPTVTGNPFISNDAFVFRYDRTVPTVSVAFNKTNVCYNIGDDVTVDLTISSNSNGNNNLSFVAESTSVNGVGYNTYNDCYGGNYNEDCNANDLVGYAYGLNQPSTLTYTVGEGDTYIAETDVVPFSVQVMDIAGNKSTVVTNISQNTSASETPTIESRLHSNTFDSFKPYDAADVETKFLYGTKANNSVISQNTDYIKIKFKDLVPEYVSDIRVYYELKNNDNYTGDFNDADDYDGSFTIPAESLYESSGQTYLEISISQLETEYTAFLNSTENQRLYIGLKFETADCNDDININCDIVDYNYIEIDRVAPKIVRYEEVLSMLDSRDYEEFLYDFDYELASVDNNAEEEDLEDYGDDAGYNVFSGPIVTKLGYNLDNRDFTFIDNIGKVKFLRSDFSTTSDYAFGYSILFSEPLYPTELTSTKITNLYKKSEDIDDFIQVNDLVVIKNTSDLDVNADSNSVNKFNYSRKLIQAPDVDFYDNDDDFAEDDEKVILNFFMLNIFLDGLVGNSDIELEIDHTKLVDAAGNRLVDKDGFEFTENIQLYGSNADIELPITLDNKDPLVSDLKVWSDLDDTNPNNPIGEDLIADECLNIFDKDVFYIETKITEENDLLFANTVPSFSINWDDKIIEEDYVNNELFGGNSDNIPYFVGIKNNNTNDIIGYISTMITPDNFYPVPNEEGAYKLIVKFDISDIIANMESLNPNQFTTIQMLGDYNFDELDENISLTSGITIEDLEGNTSNDFNSEYLVLYSNLYKIDKAFNVDFFKSLTDDNSYTIDNKAPVLDYLIANSYVDQQLNINECFTATGAGESVVVLSVSVNEKEGLCGETSHFLNASNWKVKIGAVELLPADYSVTDNVNCINCIPSNNDIKTYYIRIDLKNLTDTYTFDNIGINGAYSYSLNVTDFVGNDGVSWSVLGNTYVNGISGQFIYIDNTAPTVNITDITNGCYDNEDKITFKVNVQDNSFNNGPCTTTFTNSDSWTAKLDNVSLTNVTVTTTTDANVYEVTATIPDASFAENTMADLTVTFDDKVLNEGTDTDVDAVRIVVDEITAHIVGTGDAYDYTNDEDLIKVELCADVETFDVSYSLTYGDIISTKVYKQTGTNTAVLLTAGANNDYTIVDEIITINTESLSHLDKVYVVLETVCGDITSNSFVYDELPLPETAVITDDNNDADGEVCYDATVVFTADAGNQTGFSYNWSYKLAAANTWTEITGNNSNNNSNFTLGTDGVTLTVKDIADDYVVRAYKVNKVTDCVSAEAGESEIIKVLDRIAITTITPSEGGATPKRGNTYTYTVSGLTNDDYFEDYTWEYSGTGVTLTNASTETLTIEFSKTATPGTLSVVANASKCGSSLPVETDLEITIDATKNMIFSAVGKLQMTVAWTSGTGDGKILLGTQSTSGVTTLNKTINNTVSSDLVDLLDGVSPISAAWGTADQTDNSTVLGTTSVPYKYLLNDINNTQTSVIITGLTSNRRYNFRLIDFINYKDDNNDTYRVYQPNTNTNSRVTQSKEGEENYGNTENFISLISPNPAKDNISFSMNLVNEQPVTIEIFTIEGRQVITFKNNEFMSAGNHFLNIPLGDLAAGTYSIVIRMGDEFILDSFVVMP